MSPDDPRHGTNAGYIAGCRSECCRDAHATYRRNLWRRRYLRRVENLYVDSTPTVRRIRALQALGWSFIDIDRAMNHYTSNPGATRTHNYIHQPKVHIDNAAAVSRVYDELSMVIGPSARLRAVARRKGWAPPLAWDDIDDPNERPNFGGQDHDVDPVVVMRLLEGQRVKATVAEKEAAMERWVLDGCGSRNELARLHGWQQGRYTTRLRLVRGEAS